MSDPTILWHDEDKDRATVLIQDIVSNIEGWISMQRVGKREHPWRPEEGQGGDVWASFDESIQIGIGRIEMRRSFNDPAVAGEDYATRAILGRLAVLAGYKLEREWKLR